MEFHCDFDTSYFTFTVSHTLCNVSWRVIKSHTYVLFTVVVTFCVVLITMFFNLFIFVGNKSLWESTEFQWWKIQIAGTGSLMWSRVRHSLFYYVLIRRTIQFQWFTNIRSWHHKIRRGTYKNKRGVVYFFNKNQ